MAVAVILIGTGFRMMTAFFSVFGSHLTIKERFFIPFAWLPKATVQVSQSIRNTSKDQRVLQPQHKITKIDYEKFCHLAAGLFYDEKWKMGFLVMTCNEIHCRLP